MTGSWALTTSTTTSTRTTSSISENFFGAFANNQPIPNFLSTTSGQSNWYNDGKMKNYAVFGQLGFKFTDSLKLSVGLRQTWDKKEGNVQGLVVEAGDRFNPNDPRAVVAMETLCRSPAGAVVPVPPGTQCLPPNKWTYGEGEGFQTDYSADWNELTPQATLDWRITDDIFTYLTYSEGFKGGGFDDTPANIPQATTPFDPEKAKNYEFGIKSMMWDRRLRINADVFYMDYTDLQVAQTNAACLCNLTDNAASAEIKGVEAEFELAPVEGLRLTLAGSYVDAKYKDFIESAIDPTTGLPSTVPATGCSARPIRSSRPVSTTHRNGRFQRATTRGRATCSGPPTTSQRNLRTAWSTHASRSVPKTVRGPWPCGART